MESGLTIRETFVIDGNTNGMQCRFQHVDKGSKYSCTLSKQYFCRLSMSGDVPSELLFEALFSKLSSEVPTRWECDELSCVEMLI